MNVIVSNKQKQIIDNANIDAIKDLNGLFNVDDLISKFKNYFFNKMILDATSIVNFTSDVTLEKLAHEIGSERLYILLPENPEPPKSFTDKLIELRIYNFSTNINDIIKFLSVPNTYERIVGINSSEVNNLYSDNSIKDSSMVNMDYNYDNYSIDDESFDNNYVDEKGKIIIGIKNVTVNAGSTTFCYLLYKKLLNMNKTVEAYEINKNDFKYYQEKAMISIDESQIDNAILSSQASIIVVDLNNCKNISFCTYTFYLIEPSVIKLNKLMIENRFAFRGLLGKKIILMNNDVH